MRCSRLPVLHHPPVRPAGEGDPLPLFGDQAPPRRHRRRRPPPGHGRWTGAATLGAFRVAGRRQGSCAASRTRRPRTRIWRRRAPRQKAIVATPRPAGPLPCSRGGVYARILRTPGVARGSGDAGDRLPIGIRGLAILLFVREVTARSLRPACARRAGARQRGRSPASGPPGRPRGEGMLLPLAPRRRRATAGWGLGGRRTRGRRRPGRAAGRRHRAAPHLGAALALALPVEARPRLIPSAFALDSVLIEVIFVIGPLVFTAIVATVGDQYALVVSAACVLSGTALLLAGLRGRSGPERGPADGRVLGIGALAAPGLRTLVLASLPVGFYLGAVEVVSLPRPAAGREGAGRSSAGRLVDGERSGRTFYGARQREAPLADVHLRLACLLPLGCLVVAATSPLTIALLVILAGLPRGAADRLPRRARRPRDAAGTTPSVTSPLAALVRRHTRTRHQRCRGRAWSSTARS